MKPWRKILSALCLAPLLLVLGYGGPDPEGVYLSCPDATATYVPITYNTGYYTYSVMPYTHHQIQCTVYHGGALEALAPVDISLVQASAGSMMGDPANTTTSSAGLAFRTIYAGALSDTPNAIKATVNDANSPPHVYIPAQYLLYVKDLRTPTSTPTAVPAGIQSDSTVFPNPFNPLHGGNAHIYYKLTGDAPVKLSFYTLRGNLVYEKSIAAGDAGGRQGINVVDWDGRNGQSVYAANGVYVCVIRVSDKESYRMKIGLYKGE